MSFYKMFVGGLKPYVSEADLLTYFSPYGEIEKVDVIKSKESQISRGFAFVYFKDEESHNSALSLTHYFEGRRIDCKTALNKNEAQDYVSKERTHKVFVGGLNQKTQEESLYDYFCVYGRIYKAYLIYDHKTQQSRCFGFVEFEKRSAVDGLLKKEKHIIDGNTIECKPVLLKSELEEIGPFEGKKKKYPKTKKEALKKDQKFSKKSETQEDSEKSQNKLAKKTQKKSKNSDTEKDFKNENTDIINQKPKKETELEKEPNQLTAKNSLNSNQELNNTETYQDQKCYDYSQTQSQDTYFSGQVPTDQYAYYDENQQWTNYYQNNYQFPEVNYDHSHEMMNYADNKCPPGMEYGYHNNCQSNQDQKISFYSAPDNHDNYGNDYAMNLRFNSQPTEQDYNYMLQYPQNPQNSNYDMNNNYYQAPCNQERPEGEYFSYKTYLEAPNKHYSNETLNQCETLTPKNQCELGSTLGSRSSGDNLSEKKAVLHSNNMYSLWNSNNGSEDEKVFKQNSYPKAENCFKEQNQNLAQGNEYKDDKCLQIAFAQSDSIFLGM